MMFILEKKVIYLLDDDRPINRQVSSSGLNNEMIGNLYNFWVLDNKIKKK